MIYENTLTPEIFTLGPLSPRWYALMYILGFIATYFIVRNHPRFKGRGLSADDAMDFLTYAFFGVILGGRLGYVLFYNLSMYIENPIKILYVWQGGMSFHGGLLGSIIAILLYARSRKIPAAEMLDIVALPTPLGLFFGRIGNFINNELWGKPTDGTWGVRFQEFRLGLDGQYEQFLGPPRHPTPLYEAALEGLLLFALLWFASYYLRKLKPGSIGALFLLGYGLGRFTVEFWRIPDAQIGYLYGEWLTMGHVLSFPMILGGLLMLIAVNIWGKPSDIPMRGTGQAPDFAHSATAPNEVHFKTAPLPNLDDVELQEDPAAQPAAAETPDTLEERAGSAPVKAAEQNDTSDLAPESEDAEDQSPKS